MAAIVGRHSQPWDRWSFQSLNLLIEAKKPFLSRLITIAQIDMSLCWCHMVWKPSSHDWRKKKSWRKHHWERRVEGENGRNVPGQEAGGAAGSCFLWIVKWLPLNLHNVTLNLKQGTFYIFPLIVLAPGRCLFTTGINTHSNQRKSEAQISNSCKSLVTDTGKHNSAPNFEITNMSISEHEGYRRAPANMRAAKQ